MKILGLLLIAFGVVDLIGSYAEFDLWGGFIGIQLPEMIWQYSSFIEMGLGYFIFNLAKNDDSKSEDADAEAEAS